MCIYIYGNEFTCHLEVQTEKFAADEGLLSLRVRPVSLRRLQIDKC